MNKTPSFIFFIFLNQLFDVQSLKELQTAVDVSFLSYKINVFVFSTNKQVCVEKSLLS